jgi:hypothetical protein
MLERMTVHLLLNRWLESLYKLITPMKACGGFGGLLGNIQPTMVVNWEDLAVSSTESITDALPLTDGIPIVLMEAR